MLNFITKVLLTTKWLEGSTDYRIITLTVSDHDVSPRSPQKVTKNHYIHYFKIYQGGGRDSAGFVCLHHIKAGIEK